MLVLIGMLLQSEPLLSIKEEAIDKTFDEFNEMFLQKVICVFCRIWEMALEWFNELKLQMQFELIESF